MDDTFSVTVTDKGLPVCSLSGREFHPLQNSAMHLNIMAQDEVFFPFVNFRC